jgi:hypothetical protein
MSRARTLATVLGSDGSFGSADVTAALGYTPVNKAGDTMTGNLTVDGFSGGKGLAFRSGFEDSDNHKIYAGAVDVPGRNGGIRISAFDGVAISTGDNTFTTRLRVDMGGRVMMPFQPYARGSSNGNVTAPAVIPINLYVSSRGGISTSSDRFTVPVSGAYVVGYHHLGNSGSGACQIVITKNGSVISGTRTQDTNSANDSFSTQTIVDLAANDFIQFYTNQGVVHGNPDYNSMWIYLIG